MTRFAHEQRLPAALGMALVMVVAYDADGLPVAVSELRPIAP